MLPSSLFQPLQYSITHYIAVAVIGLILLGIEIWELHLIKKTETKNESLRKQLAQLSKVNQQVCINPQSVGEHQSEPEVASYEKNNLERGDNAHLLNH